MIHDAFLRGNAIAELRHTREMVGRARARQNVHTGEELNGAGFNTVEYNAAAMLERLDTLATLLNRIIEEP